MSAQLLRRWRLHVLIPLVALLALVATLLLRVPGSSAALGDNLIANPSAEEVNGQNRAGWTRAAWGSLDARYSVAWSGATGQRSLRVRVARYESGDAKWMFPPVDAVAGARYDFGVSYKGSVTSSVVAELTMNDLTRQYVWLADLPASDTWQRYTGSVTAPDGVSKITVFHLIAAVGWIQSDDFSLAQGTDPAADAAAAAAAPAADQVARTPRRPAPTEAPAAPVTDAPRATEAPAPPDTTPAPAPPAPAPQPTGTKCVVGMPGAGGSTDVGAGFGGGKGYDVDPARYETRTTPDLPELSDVQSAAAGCGRIIIHGFSEGARRAKELYCSGETLGGRVIGYVLDDPNYMPDDGKGCSPGAGVKLALYATRLGPGDPQWTINVYLSGLGYGDVLAKTEARLGLGAKESPNFSHIPYTNPSPPEIAGSSWW